jgi:glycosyltransferase involved in cell wall biosynthesis
MNSIRLSYILPYYNVEKYIGACLDSLYSQDIPESEYEVICIDDCSPDNSKQIVKQFQKKHSNLVLIEHKVNKCLGGARNTGLKASKGKYVWFVDSDDLIMPNSLNKLLPLCEKNDLDLLMFNFEQVDSTGCFIKSVSAFPDSSVRDGCNYVHSIFGDDLIYHLGYVWRQIYKNSYLKEKKLLFPENMFWEDTVFMPKALLYANKVCSLEESYYKYRINQYSVSGTYYRKISADLIFQFAFNAGKDLMDLSQEIKEKDIRISNQLFEKAIWYINSFIFQLLKAPISEKRTFFNLLKANKEINSHLIPYMTKLNKFLCRNPKLGLMCVIFISPAYRIKRRIKKSLK